MLPSKTVEGEEYYEDLDKMERVLSRGFNKYFIITDNDNDKIKHSHILAWRSTHIRGVFYKRLRDYMYEQGLGKTEKYWHGLKLRDSCTVI